MISKNDFTNMMMKGNGFATNTNTIQLWPNQLVPFHTGELGHVFDVEYDEDMKELEKSILDEGQLEPIIVRPETDGKYEVIAGNRRLFVATKNKLPLDCIVKELDDEDAIKLMVLSNLAKRSTIKPMTYAKAITVYMDANKKQGKRTDLTKSEAKDTISDIADEIGLSKSSARRMARLTKLIPELQERIDDKSIPVTVGVELSYLTEEEQIDLYTYLDSNKAKISKEMANELHLKSAKKQNENKEKLSEKEIIKAITPEPKEIRFVLNETYLTAFLPENLKEATAFVKAEYIVRAIENYQNV